MLNPGGAVPAATAGLPARADGTRGGLGGSSPRGQHSTALLHVALHLGSRTYRRLTWILAELAPRTALPQQIPALVERLLGGSQLGMLLVRGQLTRGELGAQLPLGLDELVDVPEDLLLVQGVPVPS